MILEASMLPPGTFKLVVESTPLVAIDFVVRAPDGKILLGKRNNRPAQGSWFVPGGRILKDEPVKLTFSRLLDDELGLRPEDVKVNPLGLYQHFYPDNFSVENFSTHYVVMAYEIQVQDKPCNLPDKQHSDYKWFEQDSLLESREVHQYTKWYFMQNKQADSVLKQDLHAL
ncbi:GDP-mannose mannosyl hydrolase [Pseudomonadales bacterium]|nr:GDP-mannose mannosyl hydrolase [Pseudomonadales bacterium]